LTGASISLIYEKDLLVRGAPGDGVQGDEVTINIKQIRSVPLSAAFSRYGLEQVEIRGVLMNKRVSKNTTSNWQNSSWLRLANPEMQPRVHCV
jgi:DNA ligase (NAD+)